MSEHRISQYPIFLHTDGNSGSRNFTSVYQLCGGGGGGWWERLKLIQILNAS